MQTCQVGSPFESRIRGSSKLLDVLAYTTNSGISPINSGIPIFKVHLSNIVRLK